MIGTRSRMFCLNVARDSSYKPIIEVFSARTACSATSRALAGGLASRTGSMNSGTVLLVIDIAVTCSFRRGKRFGQGTFQNFQTRLKTTAQNSRDATTMAAPRMSVRDFGSPDDGHRKRLSSRLA